MTKCVRCGNETNQAEGIETDTTVHFYAASEDDRSLVMDEGAFCLPCWDWFIERIEAGPPD